MNFKEREHFRFRIAQTLIERDPGINGKNVQWITVSGPLKNGSGYRGSIKLVSITEDEHVLLSLERFNSKNSSERRSLISQVM